MNIFHKRPLSLILCIMLGGLLLGAQNPNIFIGVLVLLAVFIFSLIQVFKRAFRLRPLLNACIIAFSLSLVFSQGYFSSFYATERENVSIIATVEDINGGSAYYKSVALRASEIEHENENMLLLAYINTEALGAELNIGDELYLSGNIENFSSDDSFDSKSYYTSRGYSGIINDIDNVELTKNKSLTVMGVFSSLRTNAAKRISEFVNPRVGGLISSLILGERATLDGDIKLSFTRMGAAHILALSGMHLVILAFLVDKLLSIFLLGKKSKSVIIILFVIFYVAFTGFGASVTRAGIMVIIAKLIYLFAGTRDSFTSLLLAATAICICSPNSLFDTSLWLSVLATLGVIASAEFIKSAKISLKNKIASNILASALTTLFAIVSVILISVNLFDGISTVALITSPIFSILAEILIYIGMALLFFGGLFPALGQLADSFGEFVISFGANLSSGELIYSSTAFPTVKILAVALTVLFSIFLIFKIKNKRRYVALMISVYILLISVSTHQTHLASISDSAVAFSNGKSDGILISESGERVYVDVSSANSSAAYFAINNIQSEGMTSIDKFVITNYTYNLPTMVDKLTAGIKVYTLFIPEPQNNDETSIAISIYEMANIRSLKVETYSEAVINGDFGIFLLNRSLYGESDYESMIYILGDKCAYTYISHGAMRNPSINKKASELIASSDAAIIGCFGKGGDESQSLEISADKPLEIIVFDESLRILDYSENTDNRIIRGKERVIIKR